MAKPVQSLTVVLTMSAPLVTHYVAHGTTVTHPQPRIPCKQMFTQYHLLVIPSHAINPYRFLVLSLENEILLELVHLGLVCWSQRLGHLALEGSAKVKVSSVLFGSLG